MAGRTAEKTGGVRRRNSSDTHFFEQSIIVPWSCLPTCAAAMDRLLLAVVVVRHELAVGPCLLLLLLFLM
jgi:hypothetical protein